MCSCRSLWGWCRFVSTRPDPAIQFGIGRYTYILMAVGRDLAPDWILKETLAAHRAATKTWRDPRVAANMNGTKSDDGGLTLTVLGCGTMGIAILGGIMDSIQTAHPKDHVSFPTPSLSGTSTPVE